MFFIILISLFNIIFSFAIEPRVLDLSGPDVLYHLEKDSLDKCKSLNQRWYFTRSISKDNAFYTHALNSAQSPVGLYYIISDNTKCDYTVYSSTLDVELPKTSSVLVSYKTCCLEIANLLQKTSLKQSYKKTLATAFRGVSCLQRCIMSHSQLWGLKRSKGEEDSSQISGLVRKEKQYEPELSCENALATANAFGEVMLTLLSDYVTKINEIDTLYNSFVVKKELDKKKDNELNSFLLEFSKSIAYFVEGEQKRLKALVWSKKKAIFCTVLVTLFFVWNTYNNFRHRTFNNRLYEVFGFGVYYFWVWIYFDCQAFIRLSLANKEFNRSHDAISEYDFTL